MQDEGVERIDPFVCGIIRRKVRQLIRRPEFRKQDREDLRQDLLVGLLEGLPRFDPGQGHRNPFVTTVIERTAASLVQRARAKKRDCRSLCSFNARNEAAAGAPGELAETVGQREHDARRGRHPRTDHELSQLRIDVAEVLGFLPEHLRARALQLMRSSKTQTARNFGDFALDVAGIDTRDPRCL